jgi:hypothetical protein
MNVFPPMQNERLFVPFLDEVDGTLCLPANATAAEVRALINPISSSALPTSPG